jgi:hypothetical protein
MEQELFTLADKLRELREEKTAQEAYLKDLNADIEKSEKALTEAMAEAECPNFTRNGKQFILTTRTIYSAETDQKDALYDALKKQGHESLFTVNARTLSSFVRGLAEDYSAEHDGVEGFPDWLNGLVKSYDDIGITIKKVTKS